MSRDCGCEEGLTPKTEPSEGGCIVQEDKIRIIPSGSNKLAGQERVYSNASGQEMTRAAYNTWARGLGFKGFDVAKAWFVDMGHGPIPKDVKL